MAPRPVNSRTTPSRRACGLATTEGWRPVLSTAADALSLTDVVWFPTVRRVFLCGYDLRRHPSLWAWHERMRAHPAIAPFVEPMGGLGNASTCAQYLHGHDALVVEAHRHTGGPGPEGARGFASELRPPAWSLD